MDATQLAEWRKNMVERLVFENKLATYEAISQVFDLPLSQSLTEGGLTPTARARSTPLIFLGGKTSIAYLRRSASVFIRKS